MEWHYEQMLDAAGMDFRIGEFWDFVGKTKVALQWTEHAIGRPLTQEERVGTIDEMLSVLRECILDREDGDPRTEESRGYDLKASTMNLPSGWSPR